MKSTVGTAAVVAALAASADRQQQYLGDASNSELLPGGGVVSKLAANTAEYLSQLKLTQVRI